jgi:ADP-ribose pyrophosphatase YjhB (NUDIX family)
MKFDYVIDHVIQKEIMSRLTKAESLRFSELKSEKIESNLFMYHLRQLINHELVEKNENAYQLTRLGKSYIDRSTLETLVLRPQAKVITILAVQNSLNQWLILERLHQPYFGYRGMPSGKVHYGEDLQQAAIRELKEKANLEGVDVKLRGNIILRYFAKDEPSLIVSHVVGYVFSGNAGRASSEYVQPDFRSFWDKEITRKDKNNFQGHNEIIKLLDADKVFIHTLNLPSDY